MWRTKKQREESAKKRLALAKRLWGWTPHQAQREWFCCGAQVRVAACGRRWGKTESLSVDVATLALTTPGSKQLVVAPTDAQARLLGEAVLQKLDAALNGQCAELAGLTLAVKRSPYLQMKVCGRGKDAEISFRTAGRDGRSLRGLWAHRIIVDEAARVPDGILTDVLLPMLTDVGGEYVLASSPFGRRSAFYRLYAKGVGFREDPHPASSLGGPLPILGGGGAKRRVREEEVTYASFHCPTSDNKHLDGAFLAAQREDMGESLYAQEYEAQFVDDYGAVFREEDITAAIATLPGVRLAGGEILSDPETGGVYVAGIDWGRKQDFSVVAVLNVAAHPARLVHLSRWQGTGWDRQADAAAEILTLYAPMRILADGSSIGDPVAEMLEKAIARLRLPSLRPLSVERFTFGAESKVRLVDTLTVGLAARALQFPPHRTLLAELRGFEYAPGSSGRLKMGARSGGHDDCVIALALAWLASPTPAPPPGRRILLGSQMGLAAREA